MKGLALDERAMLENNSWRLSPELEELKRKVRDLVQNEVVPAEAEIDYDAYALPPDVTQRLQAKAKAMGLWCVETPREYGGNEMSLLAQCIVSEEAAKCRMGAYIPAGGAFGWDPPNVIFQGTPEQIQRYAVPTVEKGERTFVAITEPGGGADPARSITTTATHRGGDWVLNGQKIFITAAHQSRWGIVFARSSPGTSRQGISCFIVETNKPGIKIEPVPVIRPYYPNRITFDDYHIPVENLLGEEGHGFDLVQTWLIHGRVPYAVGTVGIAQAALDIAIDYARNRQTFGGRLADRQAIQWMLVDSEIELRAARLLVYQAAWKADLGEEFKVDSSIAKLYATETANRVVDRCVQVLGGRGVMRDLPLERWYRELRIKRIGEGPSEVHRMVVGRHLVGRERRRDVVVSGT